jgi:hypothetical protein
MRVIAVIVLVLSISTIIIGKIHWNHKISAYAGMESSVVLETEQHENKKTVNDKDKEGTTDQVVDSTQYTKNLPDEVKLKVEKTAKTGKPVRFVILGSKSTSSDENGWPNLLKQQLIQSYGTSVFDVTIQEISDKNSLQVIEEELYQAALKNKPDILLFEPFILKDNGEVRMEDRLENITTIIEDFEEINPDVFIFLQPANPLYNATYYPKEVEELQRFALENNIDYLNHWLAWPDQNSSEIESYLSPDPSMSFKSIPNEKGHQLWADYLANYFISK